MSSLRELQKHLHSGQSLAKITNAMKTAAVSKYHHAMSALANFRPYQAACRRMIEKLPHEYGNPDGDRPVRRTLYVLLTGNHGFTGAYNTAIYNRLNQLVDGETTEFRVMVCGKWGADHYVGDAMRRPLSDLPTSVESDELFFVLWDLYNCHEADEIILIYQAFHNILSQTPTAHRFLPPPPRTTTPNAKDAYLYLPDQLGLLEALTLRCLKAELYGILLEAAAGANGAMLTAMQTASDNSEEMITNLTRKLNRLRQANVTTAMVEISGILPPEEQE